MTPITWQAAVDDEEQRPLLQDILEAAVDDRRQAAVDVEEQRPQLQDIFEAAMGIMSRENSRGGFPLPSSGLNCNIRNKVLFSLISLSK